MKKKLYVSPLVRVFSSLDMESQILGGSVLQLKMEVDPVQEEYWNWKEGDQSLGEDHLLDF